MVVTKMNITFVIDEEEECNYTIEGTKSNPPYDNIEIMIRRKAKKKNKEEVKEYYTLYDLESLIDDMDALSEYLYGWDDAIVNGKYKKEYVDVFLRR